MSEQDKAALDQNATMEEEEEEEDIGSFLETFTFTVEAGKPHKLDFGEAPLEDCLAHLLTATRSEENAKGELALKIKYLDVASYEGDIKEQPIVEKEETAVVFKDGESGEKDITFQFTAQHEPSFSVEGEGSVTINGVFVVDLFDEEEEEEEAHEPTEKKEE